MAWNPPDDFSDGPLTAGEVNRLATTMREIAPYKFFSSGDILLGVAGDGSGVEEDRTRALSLPFVGLELPEFQSAILGHGAVISGNWSWDTRIATHGYFRSLLDQASRGILVGRHYVLVSQTARGFEWVVNGDALSVSYDPVSSFNTLNVVKSVDNIGQVRKVYVGVRDGVFEQDSMVVVSPYTVSLESGVVALSLFVLGV